MKAAEIELAVANHFNFRQNLIVSNVSWAMFWDRELDLLVLTEAGYAYEVEIKTTMSDLKNDLTKKHGHRSEKIKRLYFAIPAKLYDSKSWACIDYYVPRRAGILIIHPQEDTVKTPKVELIRKAQCNSRYRWTDGERKKLARLGAMRIWGLKRRLWKTIMIFENKEGGEG